MAWADDSDADDLGERRPARATASKWRLVRRIATPVALVTGVVALIVGAVFAVNVVGMATNPGGFAAPAAYGPRALLPPTASQPDRGDDSTIGAAPLDEPTGLSGAESAPVPSVDPEWTARVAAATGIPARALSAYALAHVVIAEDDAACGVDWATIAAIGWIESGHGSHGAAVLDEDGTAQPAIIGPALDGKGVASIADTDGGALDGDATWDRAVGPMQFIPSTWAKWASDANGDGVADPNQIDDAALTTARYLCASGPMTGAEAWRSAVFSYNHDNDYVDEVAAKANEYAESAR